MRHGPCSRGALTSVLPGTTRLTTNLTTTALYILRPRPTLKIERCQVSDGIRQPGQIEVFTFRPDLRGCRVAAVLPTG